MIIKVHGSANWMQLTDYRTVEGIGIAREQLIDAAGTLVREPSFIVAGPGTDQFALVGVVPGIAIPAEPKADFVCPPEHATALAHALRQVDHILCIGWRGADRNLVDFMKGKVSSAAKATIVTRRPGPLTLELLDCEEGFATWVANAGVGGGCQVVRSGFTGYVAEFLPAYIASSRSNLPSEFGPPTPPSGPHRARSPNGVEAKPLDWLPNESATLCRRLLDRTLGPRHGRT